MIIMSFSNSDLSSNDGLSQSDMAFYSLANKCFSDRLDVLFKGGCVLRQIFRLIKRPLIRTTSDIKFYVTEDACLKMLESYQGELRFGALREDMRFSVALLPSNTICEAQIVEELDPYTFKTYSGPWGKFKGALLEDILAERIQFISSNNSGDKTRQTAGDILDAFNIVSMVSEGKLDMDIQLLITLLAKKSIGDFSMYKLRGETAVQETQDISGGWNNVFSALEPFVNGILDWNGQVGTC
jgi:hypothetical protein